MVNKYVKFDPSKIGKYKTGKNHDIIVSSNYSDEEVKKWNELSKKKYGHIESPEVTYGPEYEKELGHQKKSDQWIHREEKWDIKKKRFMHKLKFMKY